MTNAVRLYHGSKDGLKGSIRPISRSACDFGREFYMGDSVWQPQTLIRDGRSFLEIIEEETGGSQRESD